MSIENKILNLVKEADPEDPVTYVQSIVKSYSLQKINRSIKSCNDCGLCNHGIKSLTYGNPNSSILVVGEAVSQEQYDSGSEFTMPLMDTDGATLNRALKVIGANKSALYFINSVCCYPAKDKSGILERKMPSVKERETCKKHIDKVIDALRPAVILALGSIASNSLSHPNKIAILKDRGNMFYYRGYPVIPTFHPGYFREMEGKLDDEIMNMHKDNFLADLYNAFSEALEVNPNCGIGNLLKPY